MRLSYRRNNIHDCVTRHSGQCLSEGKLPSMPLSEQRWPGSVKAHGKARMWLRKERSVSVRLFVFPQGRAAGRGRGTDGKRLGVRSHAHHPQHPHCSKPMNIFWNRQPSSSDTAHFSSSESVLSVFLILSLSVWPSLVLKIWRGTLKVVTCLQTRCVGLCCEVVDDSLAEEFFGCR